MLGVALVAGCQGWDPEDEVGSAQFGIVESGGSAMGIWI